MTSLLLARPAVYTDAPDDIPDLLGDIAKIKPDAVVLDLPRGMASPRRVDYLEDTILSGLEELGYYTEYDIQTGDDGRKRVVVVARRGHLPLKWGRHMMETVVANHGRPE